MLFSPFLLYLVYLLSTFVFVVVGKKSDEVAQTYFTTAFEHARQTGDFCTYSRFDYYLENVFYFPFLRYIQG